MKKSNNDNRNLTIKLTEEYQGCYDFLTTEKEFTRGLLKKETYTRKKQTQQNGNRKKELHFRNASNLKAHHKGPTKKTSVAFASTVDISGTHTINLTKKITKK